MESSDERTFTIAVVGTGPSVKHQLIEGDLVIAVNSAIQIVEPDMWFSLDPTPENLAIARSEEVTGLQKIVAYPDNFDTPAHVRRLQRISVPKQSKRQSWQNDAMYYLARWGCRLGLAEERDRIHTGNGAYGALGLAYHLRHQVMNEYCHMRVVLYGVDGTKKERVTGGKPNRLDHLPLLFASAKPQLTAAGIEVLNAGIDGGSRIDCFEPFEAQKKTNQ